MRSAGVARAVELGVDDGVALPQPAQPESATMATSARLAGIDEVRSTLEP